MSRILCDWRSPDHDALHSCCDRWWCLEHYQLHYQLDHKEPVVSDSSEKPVVIGDEGDPVSALMPKFCPHCLADFENDMVEVKTSNPPKCGRCLLPLWWEDRSGATPGQPWPSYLRLLCAVEPATIPMILFCPMCRMRHVDKGEFAEKPHHTHACQHCGMVWRPALVSTVGVGFLPGFKDRP